jgi:hypothetical protein
LKSANACVPATKEALQGDKGVHSIKILDTIGQMGTVEYEIDGCAPISNEMMSGGILSENIMQYFEEEEQKVLGRILRVRIDPQAIFACPV